MTQHCRYLENHYVFSQESSSQLSFVFLKISDKSPALLRILLKASRNHQN